MSGSWTFPQVEKKPANGQVPHTRFPWPCFEHKMPIKLAMIIILFVLLPLTSSCSSSPNSPVSNHTSHIEELWDNTVSGYLQDPLWESSFTADAAHSLMVPLHYSFSGNIPKWQNDIHDHFEAFCLAKENLDDERLFRLHYLYFLSRYLVLAEGSSEARSTRDELSLFLTQDLARIWNEPAWQWGSSPFGNMSQRIRWKLDSTEVSPSYLRAIIDEEFFTFAIAADLKTLMGNSAVPLWIEEILEMAFEVFYQEVEATENGGWLLQPDVWHDHHTFAYAGHDSAFAGMEPLTRDNSNHDSSHFIRMPLWLQSLKEANKDRPDRLAFYQNLLDGLAVQFLSDVVLQSGNDTCGVILTNYMDGWNGLYRWNYETAGEGNGYGPSELSGTFNLGWWAFLNNEEVFLLHQRQAECFPLDPGIIELYVGPNTTRVRHPLEILPAPYLNGLYELVNSLAGSTSLVKQ